MPLVLSARTVDLSTGRVSGGETLTTRELDLLRYLVARPGTVVSRDELLTEVWGYAPSVVSRSVDTTVVRLRRKVEADPGAPVHLLTVYGAGYRFVETAPVSERAEPRPRRAPLVGREQELAAVTARFDAGARVVTLLGTAGVGKTRIATRIAGTGLFVDLSAARSADALVATVARSLGLPLGRNAEDQVGHALDDHELLVLDNFEQLPEDAADVVARWTRLAPHLRILVTSRRRVRVAGEAVVDVHPLDPDDAVTLFLRRARAVRWDWDPDEDELAEVRALVEALDGVPLAVELAAARIDVLEPAELRRRLSLSSLGGSLRRAIAGSWGLLAESERAFLAQASVFRGPFTLDQAEQVVALDGAEVLDALQGALHHSMLQRVWTARDARFQLYEGVRAYAAEQLPDAAPVEARLRTAMVRRGEALAEVGDADALDALSDDLDNLLAAHDSALRVDVDAAVRLVVVLHTQLVVRGPFATLGRLLDATLALAPDDPDLLRCRGHAARMLGEDAAPWLSRSAELADAELRPHVLADLALYQARGRRFDEARALAAQLSNSPHERHRGVALHTLGMIDCTLCNFDAAERQLLGARPLLAGWPEAEPVELGLGVVYVASGRHSDAAIVLNDLLEHYRRRRNRRMEAHVTNILGNAELAAGRIGFAEARFRATLSLLRRLGMKREAVRPQCNLVWVLLLLDRIEEAEALAASTSKSSDVPRALGVWGVCKLARGEAAAEMLVRAAEACRASDPAWSVAYGAYAAWALAAEGRVDAAREALSDARERQEIDPSLPPLVVLCEAHVALSLGDRQAASAGLEVSAHDAPADLRYARKALEARLN